MFLRDWLNSLRRSLHSYAVARTTVRRASRRSRSLLFSPRAGTVERLEERLVLDAQPLQVSFSLVQLETCDLSQTETSVAFVSSGADIDLSLFSDKAVIEFGQSHPAANATAYSTMTWEGGNAAPILVGVGQGSTAFSFERVLYDDVYDGIDLVFYGKGTDIEFDWIVAPDIDPSQITMVYADTDHISLDAQGNLVLSDQGLQLTQQAPFVYQMIGGQQHQVAASYQLGDGNRVRFTLGSYDPTFELIIDPVLEYSTYLGGSGNDTSSDIATDAEGNTYVIGTTASESMAGRNAGPGAFLTKFTPGGQIEYIKSIGPENSDDSTGFVQTVGNKVAIGPDGLPYVVYLSLQGDYLSYTTTYQLHISKLDGDGDVLFDTVLPVPDDPTPSAPLGHFAPDFMGVGGFAVDEDGGAYLTYQTLRSVKTASGGAGIPETDNIISKVDAQGNVEFTEFVLLLPRAIAVERGTHHIYLTATTNEEGLPVSENALQPLRTDNPNSADYDVDVYVAVLNSTASGFLGGTYLGGKFIDLAGGIALNPNQPGVVYLAGGTQSPDFPLAHAFQEQLNNSDGTGGVYDGFISVLDFPNMTLLSSTYVGGSIDRRNLALGGYGQDVLSDIALDQQGNIYVVGETNSLDFPTANPLRPAYTPGPLINGQVFPFYDFVVAKFDSSLSTLEFATYFGGSGQDSASPHVDPFFTWNASGPRLAVDAAGTIHVSGTSKGNVRNSISGNLISTADFPVLHAVQPTFGGGLPTNSSSDGAGGSDAVVLAISQRGTLVGRGGNAVETLPFEGIVASYYSPRANAVASEFRVEIHWGDGEESDGVAIATSTPGQFEVRGGHTYEKAGAYPVSVTVIDITGTVENALDTSPTSNLNVTRSAENQNGGAMAIDPTNPKRLVVVAVDETGVSQAIREGRGAGGGILISISNDGGRTWSPRRLGTGADGLPPALGDPDLIFDRFGNLFVTYLGTEGNNIVVAWSTDGGANFAPGNVRQVTEPGSAPDGPQHPSASNPTLATGGHDDVWVAFRDVSIVTFGFHTYSLSSVVSIAPIMQIPGSSPGLFNEISVGPQGEVVVVWQSPPTGDQDTEALLASSKQTPLGSLGGFSSPTVVLLSNSVNANPVPAQPLSNVSLDPRIAWAPGFSFGGRMFLTYADLDAPDGTTLSVNVVYSDDGGFTWSEPVQVAAHSASSTQFSPGIAIDPTNGNLAVTWYEGIGNQVTYFVASSGDGGKTFSEAVEVSEGQSDAVDQDELNTYGKKYAYGPSSRPVFRGGKLYPIWSDNDPRLLDGNLSAPQFDVVTKVMGVINVAYAPLIILPKPIDAVRDQPFETVVATFTQGNPTATLDDFEATILWGDDAPGADTHGVITQPGGPGTEFLITGSHTYADSGAFPIYVKVQDKRNNKLVLASSNVSAQAGSQRNPSIAVDPTNSAHAFATWINTGSEGISVATSDDGGATWLQRTVADGEDALPAGASDAHAVFDQYGNLFLVYMSSGDENQVSVVQSIDGGKTFFKLRTFEAADGLQPTIAVGPGQNGNGGSVWVTWGEGVSPNYSIKLAGAPVSGLGLVESFSQQTVRPAVVDGLTRAFFDVAVGPAGQVLLTYLREVPGSIPAGPAQIIVRMDPDGLGTQPIGPEIVATDTQIGLKAVLPAQPNNGITAEGNIAWDRSDSEHRGRVYLVYTDAGFVGDLDTDILLRYSDDSGLTWSDEITVESTLDSAFLPAIAVDQTTGNVAVSWYASAGLDTRTFLFATLFDDGGTIHRTSDIVSTGISDATDPAIDNAGLALEYGLYSGLAFVNGIFQPISVSNEVNLPGNLDEPNMEIVAVRIAVAQVALESLIVHSTPVTDFEGHQFTRQVATFTDPEGIRPASNYKARIDWGDGTPPTDGDIVEELGGGFSVTGTHEYVKLGRYPVTVSIKGKNVSGESTGTAVIENAPLTITVTPSLRVIREMEFTKIIGTLTDLNWHSKPEDFIVTIDWGDDGGSSVAQLTLKPGSGQAGAPNIFNLTSKHKYIAEKTFNINISVLDRASGMVVEKQGTVVSGDPPLEVQPGKFLDIEALAGINTGDLQLVTFTVPEDIKVSLQTGIGSYRATINWGDGQVDTNITPFLTSEEVNVTGRHRYAAPGEYHPTITVQDDSGGFYTVTLIALVEPDVTNQIDETHTAPILNPVTKNFDAELFITNKSAADIAGPLFIVIRGLPAGVIVKNFTAVDGDGNPHFKINQSKLFAGSSLAPIKLEFINPGHLLLDYTVQVFDGLKASPFSGAGLVFEPNRGQANDAVSFIARGQGYAIGLSAGAAALALNGSATQAGAAALMQIVGANTSSAGVAIDPQPGVSNYLSGNTAITAVPHFGRVHYQDVYAGIDLEYYGRDGLLEYDWIVHPGADAAAIGVRFSGVSGMLLDSAGNLRLQINGSELVQRAPVAYQLIGGSRHEVTSSYEIHTDGSVGFTLGAYDPSITLVIDPVLVYSTYLGGSGAERPESVAVDDAGNTYVTGYVGSSDFFTVNPFDPDLNQPDTDPGLLSYDSFVTKFDSQGTILFSTYLGGGAAGVGLLADTFPHSIAVDSTGHIWVAGYTESPLFPTSVVAPNVLSPGNTAAGAYLTQLSADGSSLGYSTVFHGPNTLFDIAIDNAGMVYAASFGTAFKLDPVTNTVLYSTNVGEIARAVAVDSSGQLYLTGFTNNPRFPTKNALFPNLQSPDLDPRNNAGDGFVVKLGTDGKIEFATYLGGSGNDAAFDITVDESGVIYVVGQTASRDLAVPGGLDTTLNGILDGFLIKLANDGSSVLYGTYIGGSGADSVSGVGVDTLGRTYVGGTTDSADLPTVRAQQPASGADPFDRSDAFAGSITTDGQSFAYLTYLGGSGYDEMRALAVDRLGNASYVGTTHSVDLLTRDPAQPRVSSLSSDAFIVRLLSGDAGTDITLHNAPFTTVEGVPYNGLVAFFESNGSETADQFSAMIDWGDGLITAATITGNFRSGFQVLGNHLYPDVGTHDVFVTLYDSPGQVVTATNTNVNTTQAAGRALYHIAIDTSALAGTLGQLSFQFNPASIGESPDADVHISSLRLVGGTAGANLATGGVVQLSGTDFTISPTTVLNQLLKNVTLGTRIEFDLELVGPALSQPHPTNFTDVFALHLLSANGNTPLLSPDSSGRLLRIVLNSNGTTQAESSTAEVTVAASGRATVANAPINLSIIPFTVQEGLDFNLPVATFTSGNPFENAGEFSAQIDWGDGSPVTAGLVTGNNGQFTVSGKHAFHHAGSFAIVVTIEDSDGFSVSATTGGRAILAAIPYTNDWGMSGFPEESIPISADFNGDGILDVAIGGFSPAPTSTSRGVAILVGQGDGSFSLAGFQPTGQSAVQLAVADFNHDGKLDVAAAISQFGQTVVELLLGNGDGTLQASTVLNELHNPTNLLAGDLNHDGEMDLVYTEATNPGSNASSSVLQVALGRGNGTFETPLSTTISVGFHSLYADDLNGDGIADVVLASSNFQGTTTLQFLASLGDGTFSTPATIADGTFVRATLVFEDFNADGQQDIAAVDIGNLNIFHGAGDGTFATPVIIPVPRSISMVTGDFDADGRPDLAMTLLAAPNGLGGVRVLLNDETETFTTSGEYLGVTRPKNIVIGDFDRDGHLDLGVAGSYATISVLPGIGDGTFVSAERYSTGFMQSGNGIAPEGVATADVNNDGFLDAVFIMSDGPIVTELGRGDGTFQSITSGNIGRGSYRIPVLTDVNNDGWLDVVSTSLNSGISVVLGRGDGTFPSTRLTNPTTTREAAVLADFNQDGRLDVAGTYNVGSNQLVAVSLTNADGSFQPATYYQTRGGARLLLGDFNGDSRLDLAVPSYGGISVLLGNADGTFAAAINTVVGPVPTDPHNSPESAKVGDFNGDGKLDVVQVSFSGNGFLLPGNGDGTFGAALPLATNITSRDIAVGDLNGDGKLDLVTAEESGVRFSDREARGGLSVLFGNGNGTFGAPVDYAGGGRPSSVSLADLNQDGRLDIVAANLETANVSILMGNVGGTFQNAVNYDTTGVNPRSVGIGDLNGDGKLDLAVVNKSQDVAILIGNGDGTFGPATNYAYTAEGGIFTVPSQAAIGDLNGDGRADLIVGNNLLLGNGDGTFPNTPLFTYIPAVVNADFQTSNPKSIAAGDLNGDGHTDVAVSISGTTVILFGNGNGSFLPPIQLTPELALGLSSAATRVSIADMDGDGDLDVVSLHFMSGGGGVAVWRNNGAGVFSSPLVRSVPMPKYDPFGSGLDMQVGDLNGDGFVDVVVADSGDDSTAGTVTGGISVLLGVGDGSLALPTHYALPPLQRVYRLTLADMNQDGRPEVVALATAFGFDTARPSVAIFPNNGNGTFGGPQLFDPGISAAWFLGAGDFNSDGADDILIPDLQGAGGWFSIIFAGQGAVFATDAPVTVTATTLNPVAGLAFTTQVATFIDDNPFSLASDFTASINWGDGQVSVGTIGIGPQGGFTVSGGHQYAATGTFTITATVVETGKATHAGTAPAVVTTSDQALTTTNTTVTFIEDVPFSGVVATFTDANPTGSSGDFSALIHWGDGTTSPGSIAPRAGGGFDVRGNHTYHTSGVLTLTVDIADIGGSRAIATGTAQIAPNVNQAPTATNETYTTYEDVPLVITTAQGVLTNDLDPDGNTLTAIVVTGPAHGSLTLLPNGSFNYNPTANFNGIDHFTYRAKDGSTNSNIATVNINVTAVEDGPVANTDQSNTAEDTPVIIDVLANDTNRDGTINRASVAMTTLPLHGTVRINALTGTITYLPAANYSGTDTLSYRVKDNNGVVSNAAVVTIVVAAGNDGPAVAADHYVTSEDMPLIVSLAQGVLANDVDLEATPLTATIVTPPLHGSLTLNPTGSFVYTPVVNYSGSDSFRYRASDGLTVSEPATVSIIVLAVNDDPQLVAIGDRLISEGTQMSVNGRLTDPDRGDVWTGMVDYGDGSDIQTLEFSGTDFDLNHIYRDNGIYIATVKVTDEAGKFGLTTFKVTVQNVAPTVQVGADQSSTEGTLITVHANFTDAGAMDTHVAMINWGDGTPSQPMLVQELAGVGTGVVSHAYADENNYVVTVTVTDDEGASVSDTLTATVGNAKPRVAAGQDRTIDAGMLLTLTNLFTNEIFNPNLGTLTYKTVAGSFVDPGATDTHTATINWGDGTSEALIVDERLFAPLGAPTTVTGALRGTHVFANAGTYTVTVTVTDNDGGVGSDTFRVTVNGVGPNVPPVSADDVATTNQNISVAINVLTNDNAADGALDTTTLTIVSPPSHGTTSVNAITGIVTYTPASGYAGPDSFTYHVLDNRGVVSNVATVTIMVHDATVPLDLNLNGPAVTWIKKHPPVTIVPLLTVTGGPSLAGGELTISVNEIRSKNGKKQMDQFQFASLSRLGTTSGPHSANGKLTLKVQLSANATSAQIQAALRELAFQLTKGRGLRTTTRSFDVTLADSNHISDKVTQTIHIVKKSPKSPR